MEKELKKEEGEKNIAGKKQNSKLSKIDRDLYWILGTMAFLIILFFVSSAIFQNIKKFEYEGLTFSKEKYGGITFHQYNYFFEDSTGKPRQFYLNVRTDPRENKIPIDAGLIFPEKKTVYVSINQTGLIECEYSVIAVSTLAGFLLGNDVSIKSAVPDVEEATEKEVAYTTCENRESSKVILIQKANETKITNQDNCYVIDVNNCEILPAIEKFMVQSIIDTKKATD